MMRQGKTLLIGIGAQKTGTTWLGKYFESHSDIFMSPLKELHHFDCRYGGFSQFDKKVVRILADVALELQNERLVSTDREALFDCALWRTRMIGDPDLYLRYFDEHAGTSKVACEITPSYSLLDADVFRRMVAIHEDVRFIFLMRNPVDRYWSQLRFRERRAEQRRRRFDAAMKLDGGLSDPRFVERGNYARTIGELQKSVPMARVHIEFYEHLFTEAAIRRLCTFLEIPFQQPDFSQKVNQSPAKPIGESERQMIFRQFQHVYFFVKSTIGELPESWERDIERFAERAPASAGYADGNVGCETSSG